MTTKTQPNKLNVKTRSKTLQLWINHLVSCIDLEERREYDNIPDTVSDLQLIGEVFNSEYGFRVKQVGLNKACKDYVQSLPSWLNHEFYNHAILELDIMQHLPANIKKKKDEEERDYLAVDYYWNKLGTALAVIIEQSNKVNK